MSLQHLENLQQNSPLQGHEHWHVPTYDQVVSAVEDYIHTIEINTGVAYTPDEKAKRLQEELDLAIAHEETDRKFKLAQQNREEERAEFHPDQETMEGLVAAEKRAEVANLATDAPLLVAIQGHALQRTSRI